MGSGHGGGPSRWRPFGHPFPPPKGETTLESAEAAALVREAGAAERKGLGGLRAVVAAIEHAG
ncbi:MAG: hypothetical protein ABIP48_04275 [Planctomycetota bacterium]